METAVTGTPLNRAELAAAAPWRMGAVACTASALGSWLPLSGLRSSATARSLWHVSTMVLAIEKSTRMVAASVLPAVIRASASPRMYEAESSCVNEQGGPERYVV